MRDDLVKLVGEKEKILWEGKPDKRCFRFECIFNPLLPFALVWAFFDVSILVGSIIASLSVEEETTFFPLMIIPFMLLHMMPVWLYLSGVFLIRRRYKNLYYIVTDYAVYVSRGILTKNFMTKPFAELSHVDLHRGIFDQKFGVGDIIFTTGQTDSNGNIRAIRIDSVSEYQKVYDLTKKLQKDVHADVMYPNDLRPKGNHGYDTEYKG